MKLIIAAILSALAYTMANAQLLAPQTPTPTPRPVSNAAMVIQFGSQRIEILPAIRAVKLADGQFKIVDAGTSESMTKDKLGVGYSYASNAKVLMNGDISVKLKAGYSANSLGSLAAGSKLLVPPNLYVLSASTPLDVVRMMDLLQANPAVDWVEPFIIRARLFE